MATMVPIKDALQSKKVARKRLVLVGQPNVGKSVLFNALTGTYVAVSNYPGTTVDVTSGISSNGLENLEIIDSPGVQSLIPQSDEEKVTRELILARPDLIIQVANSLHLMRALTLTLELTEHGIPMVLCLNMQDEAASRGVSIDSAYLSKILGIPVVETIATTGQGLPGLRRAIMKAAVPTLNPEYPAEVERALKDPALQARFVRPFPAVLMEAKLTQAKEIAAQTVRRGAARPGAQKWLDVLGRWCVRPWPGYLLAAVVLWGMYKFVAVFGAKIAVDFLENVVFGKILNPAMIRFFTWAVPWGWVRDLFVGPYGIFTMAFTYAFALLFPIITTFFFAMGLLEDSGYLPRLSVLLDRFFKMIGLNGKAVFPVILGLGCGTMAVLTTRILDTKKEKLVSAFLLALAIPCSAQLAVVLAMTAGLSPKVFAIWFAVLAATLLGSGVIASRVLPGSPSPFFLEIPPMRIPQVSNILRKITVRLWWYIKEVIPLFVIATLILYVLDAWGWLQVLERGASPLVQNFLGLPAKATDAFLIGFLRRDYGAAGLYQLQRDGLLTLRQTTVSLVALTLFMPCMAQVLMTLREQGYKVTIAIGLIVMTYALGVSGLVNKALLLIGWA